MKNDPYTACFTGHRIAAFEKQFSQDSRGVEEIVFSLLKRAIMMVYDQGVRTFISGGAIGVDQWAISVLLDLRLQYPDIRIIVAKPFPSQDKVWPPFVQEKFAYLCSQVDEVISVSEDPYQAWKMHVRNAWMVDHSGTIIAVKMDDVNSGGTASCLAYAQKKGLNIVHIEPIKQTISIFEGTPS